SPVPAVTFVMSPPPRWICCWFVPQALSGLRPVATSLIWPPLFRQPVKVATSVSGKAAKVAPAPAATSTTATSDTRRTRLLNGSFISLLPRVVSGCATQATTPARPLWIRRRNGDRLRGVFNGDER